MKDIIDGHEKRRERETEEIKFRTVGVNWMREKMCYGNTGQMLNERKKKCV